MNPIVKELIAKWKEENSEPICAYVYDLDGIRKHVRDMLRLMPKYTRLFYAIKANPDKQIIQALLPLVAGFEVASIGELSLVREVSIDVPILFGGPGKKVSELRAALQMKVTYVHVESLHELQKLIWLAHELDQPVNVLLRVNLRTDILPHSEITMGGRPSQFGLDEPLIEEAIKLLQESSNRQVSLHGFHFHSLSNNKQAELHADMVRLYLQKVEAWKLQYRLRIEIVNAGGGFGVTYRDEPGFDWQHFMSLLTESGELNRPEDDTLLYFESGRYIVADHGYYIAEVIDMKSSQGQNYAVIRGGTHHNRLPASWGHNHPFYLVPIEEWGYPFPRPSIKNSCVTIVGELCTPKDRMHADADMEQLRVGDVLVFQKSGAYCWTISHHDFLGHPHPTFYYINEEERA